jgi:hypothetical protein
MDGFVKLPEGFKPTDFIGVTVEFYDENHSCDSELYCDDKLFIESYSRTRGVYDFCGRTPTHYRVLSKF